MRFSKSEKENRHQIYIRGGFLFQTWKTKAKNSAVVGGGMGEARHLCDF